MDQNREKGTLVAARFLRLPSLAERIFGRRSSLCPDPRSIEQMQDGIEALRPRYEELLHENVDHMMGLIVSACENRGKPRDQIYLTAHDTRGIAGTFGFTLLGRIAHSLCAYLELGDQMQRLDYALVSLHVSAMQNALAGRSKSDVFEDNLVRQLETLVARARKSALHRARERSWL